MLFLFQLQHEKAELEQHLEQEQEFQVNKLMKKIKKLENDTISKQLTLEQVPSSNNLLNRIASKPLILDWPLSISFRSIGLNQLRFQNRTGAYNNLAFFC